jgi:hypothetical protein
MTKPAIRMFLALTLVCVPQLPVLAQSGPSYEDILAGLC